MNKKGQANVRKKKANVRRKKRAFGEKSERSEKARRQQENREKEPDNFDIENSELNEKQKIFCIYYVRCFNATKAYQKAYECSYESAMRQGNRLLRNVQIQKEIQNLKQDKLNQTMLKEEDIFQKYIDIAFADITDYVEFDKTGVRLKKSRDTDGTIISEVKKGKDGITLKLADRMKALQWLTDHMDFATPEQKERPEGYFHPLTFPIRLRMSEKKEIEDIAPAQHWIEVMPRNHPKYALTNL